MMSDHIQSTRAVVALRSCKCTAGIAALSLAFAGAGCISTDSDVLDATEGCDELERGNAAELDIDPQAQEFILASEDVSASIDRVSDDVFAACSAIAIDLGADDTWSGEAKLRDKISNDADTGACDVALLKIDDRLTAASEANIDVRVALAKGECHLEFDTQSACDAECAKNTSCTPGGFEARCKPGSISSICDGDCMAGAFCVGSAKAAANCQGQCEAECVGACAGECIRDNGEITENDPACQGFCTSRCEGTCSGQCKVDVEAGIACGAGVYCRGTCEGVMESPACVTEFDDPECEVDTACYESCTARLATEATCSPTEVKVIADVALSPDLEPLVGTLNAHLPTLIDAAQAEGKLVQRAGKRMADAGHDLNERVDDLDGKSLACVGTASSALANSVDTISVSVDACLAIQTEVNVGVEEETSSEGS